MTQDVLDLRELRPSIEHDARLRVAEVVRCDRHARQTGVSPDHRPDPARRDPEVETARASRWSTAVVAQKERLVTVGPSLQIGADCLERRFVKEYDPLTLALAGD